VLKVQHKPIKRSKFGFKIKEQKKPKRTLVWHTGQCPMHQGGSTSTLHLRVSKAALRYNSPDCPVGHRTVWCAKRSNGRQRNCRLQRSADNVNSARTVRAESEQRQKAHRTVNSACPVPQVVRAPTVETVRTLTVG
jgi:hypothetical protein